MAAFGGKKGHWRPVMQISAEINLCSAGGKL